MSNETFTYALLLVMSIGFWWMTYNAFYWKRRCEDARKRNRSMLDDYPVPVVYGNRYISYGFYGKHPEEFEEWPEEIQ